MTTMDKLMAYSLEARGYAVLNRLGDRMRNIFRLRIVKAEYQLLYVLVAVGLAFAINDGLSAAGVPRVVELPIALLISLSIYFYGARVFRGENEIVELPRPWWQMTAKSPLSTLLGLVFVLLTILLIGVIGVAAAFIPAGAKYGPAFANQQVLIVEAWIPFLLYAATLVFFYTTSSIRLSRVASSMASHTRWVDLELFASSTTGSRTVDRGSRVIDFRRRLRSSGDRAGPF